jgi:hypothetical protein
MGPRQRPGRGGHRKHRGGGGGEAGMRNNQEGAIQYMTQQVSTEPWLLL